MSKVAEFQGGPGNLVCESLAPQLLDSAAATIAHTLSHQGYAIVPNFLPKEETQNLAKEAALRWTEGEFSQARIGRGGQTKAHTEIRSDRVLWLAQQSATPAQARYLDRLSEVREAINRETFAGLFDWEGHLAVYPIGAFYRAHVDRFKNSSARLVTTILYLNDAWAPEDAGQLRIWLEAKNDELHDPQGPYLDIPPIGGTLVVFWSDDFVHEVLPANFERMSITGWFRHRIDDPLRAPSLE